MTSYPYRIATLVYAFNDADQVLLLKRRKQPNQNLWSPFGGKLQTAIGESPYRCAIREAREEIGVIAQPTDFHLTGLVSEHGYAGEAHWLMFLFEFLPRLHDLPSPIDEGVFQFFAREELHALDIPSTDRERIWPLFWKHRRGFFAAHCHCSDDGNRWTVEQSEPRGSADA